MKKFRVIIDMKKEEQYLEEMASQGWRMTKYNSWNIYTFEKSSSEILNYRIDYQLFNKKANYVDYLTLFEDSGWKHINGNRHSGYHFFLPEKKTRTRIEHIFR